MPMENLPNLSGEYKIAKVFGRGSQGNGDGE
jgi:hypothetical protein